ncbi:MAG: hypothetical protein ABIO70_00100 [Pseudomonadota bacterium]
MYDVPDLPADVFIQLFNRSTGQTWRIAADGRYFVTEPSGSETQRMPESRAMSGHPLVVEAERIKVIQALDACDFFALPPRIEGTLPETPPRLFAGMGSFSPQVWAFSARQGERVAVVEVSSDPRVPSTLGPLAPLYKALDQVALGGWRRR